MTGRKAKGVSRSGGFTLVEMLVALTIFSIGMLAIVGMFTSSFSALRNVRTLNTATRISQKMLETLNVDPYNTTKGLTAIVNGAMNEPGAVILNSTNPVKLRWPEPGNASFLYNVTVSVQPFNIDVSVANTISVKVAESRVEWVELNTPKMVNVVTYLPATQ